MKVTVYSFAVSVVLAGCNLPQGKDYSESMLNEGNVQTGSEPDAIDGKSVKLEEIETLYRRALRIVHGYSFAAAYLVLTHRRTGKPLDEIGAVFRSGRRRYPDFNAAAIMTHLSLVNEITIEDAYDKFRDAARRVRGSWILIAAYAETMQVTGKDRGEAFNALRKALSTVRRIHPGAAYLARLYLADDPDEPNIKRTFRTSLRVTRGEPYAAAILSEQLLNSELNPGEMENLFKRTGYMVWQPRSAAAAVLLQAYLVSHVSKGVTL